MGGWVGSGAGKVRDWMASAGRSARDTSGNRDGAGGTTPPPDDTGGTAAR